MNNDCNLNKYPKVYNCYCIGPVGPEGPQGPVGPAGPPSLDPNSEVCSFCARQMTNVIKELIAIYPTDTWVVNIDSGANASGRPNALSMGPGVECGVLQLKNAGEEVTSAIPTCQISSIQITSADYNDDITYLPAPTPVPSGCCYDCAISIKNLLPVGTENVRLKAGGQTVATGNVLKQESGMIVVVDNNNQNPAFVSLCKIENIDGTVGEG